MVSIVPIPDDDESSEPLHLFTATRLGQVKRTPFSQYKNVRMHGLRAVRIPEGDALLAATLTSGASHVVLTTRNGKAIRFQESEVRPSGRDTMGVKGITLRDDDEVVSLVTVDEQINGGVSLLTVTRQGYGKMSSLEQYPLKKHRGGLGVRNISAKNKPQVVRTVAVRGGEDVILITAAGKAVRIPVDNFRDLGRTAQGVRAQQVGEGDEVVAVTRIPPPPPDEEMPAAEDPAPAESEPSDSEEA